MFTEVHHCSSSSANPHNSLNTGLWKSDEWIACPNCKVNIAPGCVFWWAQWEKENGKFTPLSDVMCRNCIDEYKPGGTPGGLFQDTIKWFAENPCAPEVNCAALHLTWEMA
jgi:hypothetical protein